MIILTACVPSLQACLVCFMFTDGPESVVFDAAVALEQGPVSRGWWNR